MCTVKYTGVNKVSGRYIKMAPADEDDLPAFRQECGLCYSHAMFNRDLRTIFEGRVQYGAVSAHSFRQDIMEICHTMGKLALII